MLECSRQEPVLCGTGDRKGHVMAVQKILRVGCGFVVGIAVVLVIVFGVCVYYGSQGLEGAAFTVKSPMDVRVGEVFDFVVEVTNARAEKTLELGDIDVSEDYLAGFTVVATEPEAKSSMHIPIDNTLSFTFDTSIPAGETKAFTFKLRAETAGMYRGDVDVCEGIRFTTRMAQTVVKE